VIPVRWSAREVPLPIAGVWVDVPLVSVFLERLDASRGWQGVVARGALIVLDAGAPWVDGIRYLGEAVPGVYTDTRLQPSVPLEILSRAFPGTGVWLPDRRVDLSAVAGLDLDRVRDWAAGR
jgi:hypothetical protein